jgi:SAM-dependent methyltransferase
MSTPKHWHSYLYELPGVKKVIISNFGSPTVEKCGFSSVADVVADFCAPDLPLAEESVDCVYCGSILEHCTRPLDMVRNLARITKPGGALFFTTPFAYIDGHQHPDYWRFGRDGYLYLAEQAKLEVVETGSVVDMGRYYRHEFGVNFAATAAHGGVPVFVWLICHKPRSAQKP